VTDDVTAWPLRNKILGCATAPWWYDLFTLSITTVRMWSTFCLLRREEQHCALKYSLCSNKQKVLFARESKLCLFKRLNQTQSVEPVLLPLDARFMLEYNLFQNRKSMAAF